MATPLTVKPITVKQPEQFERPWWVYNFLEFIIGEKPIDTKPNEEATPRF